MLKAVRDLGKYIIEHEGLNEEELFIEKTELSGTKKVICVVFEEKNGSLNYCETYIEEYDPKKSRKYLYRHFKHNRYEVTPTAKPSSVDKLKGRWGLWFGESYARKNQFWGSKLIESLTKEILEENKKEIREDIFNDIKNKYGDLEKEEKKNVIFTIKIREDGKDKYIGDFDIFRRILKEEARKKFFKAHGVESKGDGKCYLCGNEGEVYGFASPFSVFTVDKKGFAPQFLRENSWKQLPICEGCAVSLIVGKEFLDKYLSKRFYGYKFYVIPSFTFGDIQDEVISEIKDLEKGEYRKTFLLVEEDEILDIIKEKEDIISLIFVFYKTKQKDYFDIVKYVEDVPPSWIKKLLDTFNEIGRKQIFKEEYLKKIFEIFGNKWANDFIEGSWNGKKEKMDLGGITRTFFPASKETGIYDKYFIDIIGDILAQRNINSDFLITAFIREIRSKHVNSDEFKERLFALKSLYLLSFIDKLGLIEGGDKMGENKKEKIELKHEKEIEKVERFFKEFENAFDRADKKAVFLEGVLARFLLNVQKNYYGRSSAPFRSKLHGLKLDKKKVRKLLPEMVEKLAQYKEAKSYYSEYPWLKELVSKYLIYADNDGWSISKDEISYYFALGLNLADIFKDK